MHHLFPARARRCAAIALLAGCADGVPQSPNAGGEDLPPPAFAIGLFGLAGAPTGPGGRPCTSIDYRAFDFWLGTWEITEGGQPAGTNLISSALDGCAVLESYAAQGFVGRSLNSYDAATGQWHQHWSDNSSTVLDLYGGSPATGSMILRGFRPLPSGSAIHDRITWTVQQPDQVRQLWELSNDGGETYNAVQFDGLYDPRISVTPDPAVPTGACTDATIPPLFELDFTLGSWAVDVAGPHPSDEGARHASSGGPRLRSVIAKDLDDCLIEERLSGPAGYEAIVFSSVRRRLGQWVRTFVDNRGTNAFLTGRVVDGRVVLTGTAPGRKGAVEDVRVFLEQDGADGFTQRWEKTDDEGATWTRLLVARYSRR